MNPSPPDAVRRHPFGGGTVAAKRALLLAAAVAALLFLHSPGTSDVRDFWLPFLHNMEQDGLVEGFRANAADYPPLSHAILLVVGRVCAVTGADDFVGIKVCLLLFYGLSIVIFQACWQEGLAPLTLFVGTVLLSSMLLGYLDILYTPTLLLALWALGRRRIALFSALFAVTCLIKWQPVIFAPFAVWHALRPTAGDDAAVNGTLVRRFARLAIPGGLVLMLVAAVFGRSLFDALHSALTNPYLSGTALNINWAWTYLLCRWNPAVYGPLTDGQTGPVLVPALHGWVWLPKALFAGVYAVTLWRFGRGENSFPRLLRAALFGYLAYCLFNTGVHENHFFVAAILASLLASVDAGETARAIIVTAMASLNLVVFYGFTGTGLGFSYVVGIDLTLLLALLYVAVFLWWWVGWLRTGASAQPPVPGLAPESHWISPKSA